MKGPANIIRASIRYSFQYMNVLQLIMLHIDITQIKLQI